MTPPLLLSLLLLQSPGPEDLSRQALEQAQSGRAAEAERLWKKALEVAPDHYTANFNLGFLLHSQQRYADAEPYLTRAAKIQPKKFNARYLAGAVLQRLGRTDEALRQWRFAIELEPGNVKLMQIMAVEYSKGRYFREAADIAERALSRDRSDPGLFLIAVKSHQDAVNYAAALRVAENFVKAFPKLARANFEYGFELRRAGRQDEALPFLEAAIKSDPSYEEPYFFSGEIMLSKGRAHDALALFRKAIELKPAYMAARTALARALIALRRDEEAKVALLEAAEIDPRHPQPHLLLSQVYLRLGDEERASEAKETSLKLRRENPQALESPQSRPFPR